MRIFAALFFAALLLAARTASNGDPPAAAADSRLGLQAAIVQTSVAVKMRDGVTLRADVMLPAAQGKFPVLVYRTPYSKNQAPSTWTTFPKAVARGYAVV